MKMIGRIAWVAAGALVLSAFAETPGTIIPERVNVRGSASLVGEVVSQLKKGDAVTILEEIEVPKPKPGEPGKWLKIALPTGAAVWTHAQFVDAATKTVKPAKLNLRAGPGENYSVIGRLPKGTAIKEIRTEGDWVEIEPPAGAYAFIAADLVSKGTGAPAVEPAAKTPSKPAASDRAPSAPAPAATQAPAVASAAPRGNGRPPLSIQVEDNPPLVAKDSAAPTARPPSGGLPPLPGEVRPAAPAPQPQVPVVPTPAPASVPAATTATAPAAQSPAAAGSGSTGAAEEPLPKRVVTREGVVRRTYSIQAPSRFRLESRENGRTINYLQTQNLGIKLDNFKGRAIEVTGEELMDRRWDNIPVIEVDTIRLVP